ncbi:dTDP-4-amino-4,6-dideoxygalactose transaminase [Constrictibacter sp. MBR-5]|jgi:dTDP-4-amino-4,6-dideoxygalactose transaminase|uniref:DegT/DnrJ/EryC1/StrS family aminotransferase n=1 Tax=Constrictibacter sp. MBR-5 TaxID=3156467 RepID=UPI0033958993
MRSSIPFLDLVAQQRSIRPELHAAVTDVLDSGQYVLGETVDAFERSFAAHCGTRHAVAVNTGTSALHLALLAAGVGPGDEVVTVAMTFVATAAAILYAGATPRFVDVDPVTWTMDPVALEAAVTPRTKAIIPVHLHGRLANMAPIREIARRCGAVLIEDAAQAHGASDRGQRAGSLGDLGCFSFYPGKNLGACGEGGAVVTDVDELAAKLRMLRDWGQSERYRHVVRGFNYRMDAVQAAVLDVKLRHLDGWTAGRRAVAAAYDRRLAVRGIVRARAAGSEHVWHVYAVRAAERDAVRRKLADAGVATGIHYPVPVHLQPAYSDLGYGPGDLPVSERLAREFLSLPIYPELGSEQIAYVCDALEDAVVGEPADVA